MAFTILVTNDDGIRAPGIQALAVALLPLGCVYCVAPDREMSAAAHSITVNEPIRVSETRLGEIQGWAVSGTPTDCVKIGVEALLEVRPDIVVSGVNRGANLGTDVLYSGTVSAAVEAVILGIPGVAISLVGERCDFSYAASAGARIAQDVLGRGLPPDTLLNVNVPDIASEQVMGVRVTRLGTRRYENVWDKRKDPRGRTYYWMGGSPVDLDSGHDVDSTAVGEGYISVTPIHFDFTHYSIMRSIASWNMTPPGAK